MCVCIYVCCSFLPFLLGAQHNFSPLQVATREDCASAYLGETLYHFLYRSVRGNVRDAVDVELKRLQAKQLPVWSLHNR